MDIPEPVDHIHPFDLADLMDCDSVCVVRTDEVVPIYNADSGRSEFVSVLLVTCADGSHRYVRDENQPLRRPGAQTLSSLQAASATPKI